MRKQKITRVAIAKKVPFDLAVNERERTKIGKTLDTKAFLAFHAKNGATAGYWETAEYSL